MSSKYMADLAEATGLHHYPGQGPFGQKDGSVIGNTQGYLLAIGPVASWQRGLDRRIRLLLRFQEYRENVVEPKSVLVPFLEAVGFGSQAQSREVGSDFFRIDWEYQFSEPPVERVADLAAALINGIKPWAVPFDGRCQVCHSNPTPEITLFNGTPSYYCDSCQQRTRVKGEARAAAYNSSENWGMSVLLGSLTAMAGAIAWTFLGNARSWIYSAEEFHEFQSLFLAPFIGACTAQACVTGMGKINLHARLLGLTLTTISILLGEVSQYTLSAMRFQDRPFSLALLGNAMAPLFRMELNNLAFPVAIFAGVLSAWLAFPKQPTFSAKFVALKAADS